jgi:hypothetical protein
MLSAILLKVVKENILENMKWKNKTQYISLSGYWDK